MHTIKPRNPHACAPIMKKGGAHARSRSGQRQAGRQAMLAELDLELDLNWHEADAYPPQPQAAADDEPAVFGDVNNKEPRNARLFVIHGALPVFKRRTSIAASPNDCRTNPRTPPRCHMLPRAAAH